MTITAQEPSRGYIRVFRQDATDEWQQVGSFTDAPKTLSASSRHRREICRFTTPRSSVTALTFPGTAMASSQSILSTPAHLSASGSSSRTRVSGTPTLSESVRRKSGCRHPSRDRHRVRERYAHRPVDCSAHRSGDALRTNLAAAAVPIVSGRIGVGGHSSSEAKEIGGEGGFELSPVAEMETLADSRILTIRSIRTKALVRDTY